MDKSAISYSFESPSSSPCCCPYSWAGCCCPPNKELKSISYGWGYSTGAATAFYWRPNRACIYDISKPPNPFCCWEGWAAASVRESNEKSFDVSYFWTGGGAIFLGSRGEFLRSITF